MQQKQNRDLTRFRTLCRQHNLRLTPQRAAVYKAVAGSLDHPSADTVYRLVKKRFPEISFDTVNRTLLRFAESGILGIVEGFGEPRRYDPNTEGHHHFHCIGCNKIVDFESKRYDDLKIPEPIHKRFTILSKRVVLNGLCEKCSGSKRRTGGK